MLSPQIYRHNFDKTLYLNALGYPFHRMSSRFTTGKKTKGRKTEESGIKVRRTYPDDKRKRGWTHGRKEEKGNGRKATNKSDKEK